MAKMKLNQNETPKHSGRYPWGSCEKPLTKEPISLSKMQDYAYFFSGLSCPVSSEDVAMKLGVKTETVRLPAQVTPKDVAVMLGIKTETVKRWLKRGELKRLDMTSLKTFINTKPERIRATYNARMTLFAAFIGEAVKQICGTLAFSISLVNTVEQLGALRKLAAIPSARIPTESFVYEKLLSMYCNAIQLPYDVTKAYARQTCAPDKIFVSGRFRESALDAIKNGREECRLETLETRYNRYEAIMTIEFTLRANRPVDEGSALDNKHEDLEVDDG